MNDCDVVENTACGKAFKYCRTHKTEPHECPGAKADATGAVTTALSLLLGVNNFEIAPRQQAPARKCHCDGKTYKDSDAQVTVQSGLTGICHYFCPYCGRNME